MDNGGGGGGGGRGGGGGGGEGGGVSLLRFSADQKTRSSWRPIARATCYCLLPDTF